MGVVFFPSLPFMGVMLFPSSWLGNASRGWGVVRPLLLTPRSPLFLPPSLLYLSPFLFFSLFFLSPPLSHLLLLLSLTSVPIFFSSSPPSCLLFIMSFSFVSLPFFFLFFLRELLVLYAFYDVIEDTIDCNQP